MLTIALWWLGGVVLAGVALGGFHLAERPIRGAARLLSLGHGAAGAAGVALAVVAVMGAADRQGFGRLATYSLLAALALGLVVAVSHLRGRRPAGVVIAVHAVIGVAALTMLAAYVSVG